MLDIAMNPSKGLSSRGLELATKKLKEAESSSASLIALSTVLLVATFGIAFLYINRSKIPFLKKI